jgi:sec-independent protein translocase protein TatC
MATGAEDPFERTRMTLGEHLDELRTRLFRGLIALALAFAACWFLREQTTDIVMRPMGQSLAWLQEAQVAKYERLLAADPTRARSEFFTSDDPANRELRAELSVPQRPQALGFTEPFWFAMKVTLLFGSVLGGPVLLWQMWQFIAAGLYARERRLVLTYFPASVALFLAGILFGYFVLVPYGFFFLAKTFAPEKVAFAPRLSEYFSLLVVLTVSLGVVFQLPAVMHVLVRLDLVRRETFARHRAQFIVGAFVVGAVVTPSPDVFTQVLVSVPMVALFELGLLLTRSKGRAAEAGAEEARA